MSEFSPFREPHHHSALSRRPSKHSQDSKHRSQRTPSDAADRISHRNTTRIIIRLSLSYRTFALSRFRQSERT